MTRRSFRFAGARRYEPETINGVTGFRGKTPGGRVAGAANAREAARGVFEAGHWPAAQNAVQGARSKPKTRAVPSQLRPEWYWVLLSENRVSATNGPESCWGGIQRLRPGKWKTVN